MAILTDGLNTVLLPPLACPIGPGVVTVTVKPSGQSEQVISCVVTPGGASGTKIEFQCAYSGTATPSMAVIGPAMSTGLVSIMWNDGVLNRLVDIRKYQVV